MFSTYDHAGVNFEECSFRHVHRAIVHLPPSIGWYLHVNACTFQDVEGAAISLPGGGRSGFAWGGFFLTQCRFESCGSALKIDSPPSSLLYELGMQADTILSTSATAVAVSAPIQTCTLEDIQVSGAGGLAVDLKGVVNATVRGSLFTNNRQGGVRVRARQNSGIVISENTFALNGGPGLTISPDESGEPSPIPATVEGNIFAGNDDVGVLTTWPSPVTLRRNDAWMNERGLFAGLADADSNLTLDPQFCDPLAGDFRVAASSPCGPSGPYGQIGALGVGCSVMTVPVDVQPHSRNPINLRSNAPVEAAILGQRLFDVRRVDPLTVRLAGAPPSPRGNGGASTQIKDVNQDGTADLVLAFDSRDLHIEGGEVTMEGRTFDGAPFRGSDVVQIAGTAPRASVEAAADMPTRLALAIPPTHGKLALLLDLPRNEPAAIEVFDVAGRRVLSQDVSALGPGRHRIQLQEALASGLYLVRARQGTEAVVVRAVVLR
jgi:hypothetical protein